MSKDHVADSLAGGSGCQFLVEISKAPDQPQRRLSGGIDNSASSGDNIAIPGGFLGMVRGALSRLPAGKALCDFQEHEMRAIVLAIGLVCVTGCGRQAEEAAVEKAIELQTGGTARVDLSKETMQIETEEGKMTMSSGEGAKLPDSFPQDIYVLDGAKIEMAMEVPQGYSLAFTTDKDRAAVAEQYKKQMTSAGWTQKAAMDMGEQVMLAYEKPERAANIVITADESVTRVNVTVAQQ